MVSYNYNINLRVRVSDRQLTRLEQRIRKLKNQTINVKANVKEPKWNTNSSRKYWDSQLSSANQFHRKMQQTQMSMQNFQRDYSRTARELNTSYSGFRATNSLGRRMGVAREKGSRLMDVGAGVGTYFGLSSLKKILYDTPIQAETNKWLMGTMGDETADSKQLYSTLDATTDRLPISMQSVAQPLYAFKAASGASAETIDKIIPQFANFGAVVQNMTGSTELAETAMMKLAYGLKGRYAALDQYGITEDALKRNGWSGDEKDVEGYLAAVSKIVGNAEDSMTTFAGRVKLVEKSLARAGKQIWESGLGDALKGVLAGISGVMDWNGGILTKMGIGAVAATTAILGVTAATGYLLQAIGSMTESFMIIKAAVGDATNAIATKFGATGSMSAIESRLQASKNPHYVAGVHDYNKSDVYYSGLSGKQKAKLEKSKKRDKDFVKRFGWGEETERRIKSVRDDKVLSGKEKKERIKNIRKSRLNEINQMGFRGRFATAGRRNALGAMGSAMREGWSGGSGFGKITGAFSGLSGVFGSLVGVINPVTIALGAFAAALGVLAGIFLYAYHSSEAFRNHVQRVGQLFMELMGAFGGLLGDVFQGLGITESGGLDGLIEVADKILSAIESGFKWVKGVIEGMRGKDSTAEKGYQDAYKTSKEAEDRIHKAQREGKSPQDYEKDRQTYEWAESRKKYFSRGGGYWDQRFKELEEENPGWKIPRNADPSAVLRQNAEYLKGDLSIEGVGQYRTYDPQVVAEQKRKEQLSIGKGKLDFLPGGKEITNVGNLLQNALKNSPLGFLAGKEPTSPTDANGQAMDSISANTLNVGSVSSPTGSESENTTTSTNSTGSGFDSVTKGLGNVISQHKQGLSIFEKDADDAVQKSYGEMGVKIAANAPAVGQASQGIGDTASTSLSTGLSGMNSTAESEAGKVAPAISSQSPRARSAASQVGNAANSGFGNLTWASTVQTEISNVISNIINAIPKVASAVSAFVGAANTQQKTDMNVGSPGLFARRYEREMKYTSQLIRSGIPWVVSSVSDLVNEVNSTFVPFSNNMVYPSFNDYLDKNPVDIYKNNLVKKPSVGVTKPTEDETVTHPSNKSNPNQPNINLTLNIGSVDSEDRVREIQEVIYQTLFWNNETAGRNEPTPIL